MPSNYSIGIGLMASGIFTDYRDDYMFIHRDNRDDYAEELRRQAELERPKVEKAEAKRKRKAEKLKRQGHL